MSLSRRPAGPWLPAAALALLGAAAVASVLLAGAGPEPAANLLDSLAPPAFLPGGTWAHPLGADAQGRDMLDAVFAATRLSLATATLGVLGALALGVVVGLVAGQAGGLVDTVAMRAADVQLTFPALLVALLADAAFRLGSAAPPGTGRTIVVLGAAIALGRWPPIARLVRATTRREWRRDYVAASRLAGASVARVLATHVAPNILGSTLALAAFDLGLAIMDESTLSYVGLGLPPDRPSLGALIRDGQQVMLSGAWWVVLVPGFAMVVLVACAGLGAEAVRLGLARAEP